MKRTTTAWASTKGKGHTLGVPSVGEWLAPPPMQAPHPDTIKRPDNLHSTHTPIDAAVEQLLAAYDRNLQSRPKAPHTPTDNQWASYSVAVVMIINARVSIVAYVTFAMRHMRELRGRTPYRSEVLSPRSVTSWLPQYLKRPFEVLSTPTYQSSNERRQLWREWTERARTINRALPL